MEPYGRLWRAARIVTALLDRLSTLRADQLGALLAGLDGPREVFTPLPGPQTEAYNSKADELLFGGAAGGSKSYLLLGTAATRHQRSLILRRQSTELDGLQSDLCAMLGHDGYNKVDKEHTAGGRSIKLGGCREPDDWRHFAGRPRDMLGVDEAGEFLEEQVSSLLAWLRSTDPKQRCRLILASNPPRGAEGEWLLRWFAPWLDPAFANPARPGELRWYVRAKGETKWVDGPGRVEVAGEGYTPRSRTFIPALLSDNPFLDSTGYRATLQSLPEPLRSQLLKGDFLAGREDDAWQVIPAAWVEAAQQRWSPGIQGSMDALGVDVAQGGSDATVLAARHGRWFAPLKSVPGRQTPDGVSVASLVFGEVRDGAVVVVDAGGGWGSEASGHLGRHLSDDRLVAFMGVTSSNETSANNIGFVNLRAQAWWRFREALDPQTGAGVALPPDPALAADLAMPRWKMVSRGGKGAIQIEAKDDIRKRLGRSPDRGDAVVMAWAYGGHRPQDADWSGPMPAKWGRAAQPERLSGDSEEPRILSQEQIHQWHIERETQPQRYRHRHR